MKGFKVFAIVLALAAAMLMAAGPAAAGTSLYQGTPAKYVFLFIGDGMGFPQKGAAEQYAGKRMGFDNFTAQGVTTTHAADRFITGSAASATALGAGQKTNIGMIGMSPDQKLVKSLAELAKEQGQKVGIVSSVSIDHATPAAFYAHVPSRSQYHYIDHQLAESGFDFFGGGGLKDPQGKRKGIEPKGDALAKAKENGYKVVTDKAEFLNLDQADGKILAYNAWLQDSGALPYAIDTRPQDITIAEFTAKAIELLDNPKGFFLMVEGGKIDWACHANDGASAIHDTLAFDEAVAEAVKFYLSNPKDTLIVVTGDHECGGLTLGWAGTKYASNFQVLRNQKASFQKFDSEIMADFNGDFDAVKPLITEYFGLKFEGAEDDIMVLKPHEVKQIKAAFKESMAGEKEKSSDPTTYVLYGGYDPLTVKLTHILDQKAGLGWTSYKHTGVPVGTNAMGVGAEVFNGYYDNTDVALKLMSVMGLTPQIHYMAEAEAEEARKIAAAN
jgi:alkaline phosphatase